jgi:hypothetical protein
MATPTALAEAADALDAAVVAVVHALERAPARGYEAEIEARLAIGLIIRHVEGIALLARDGAATFPAAMTLARAAYEGGLRTLWLLDPDEPFERERRWLTHLQDTERFYDNCADAYDAAGETAEATKCRALSGAHRDFRLGVEAKLPAEIERPAPRLPNLRELATELGREQRYVVYRIASQYAHATHVGTGLYRRNLGVAVVLGDFASEDLWPTPLSLSWFALEAPTRRLLECSNGDIPTFENELPRILFGGALKALRGEG